MKTRNLVVPVMIGCALAVASICVAQRNNRSGGFAPRGETVDRFNHGSVRHEATHVVHVPEVRRDEHVERRSNVIVSGRRPTVHHDVDLDVHGRSFWHGFVRGQRFHSLPRGFLSFHVGALPYFYYGGIFYQEADGGYEEVYPPVGAIIPTTPENPFEVIVGGQVFYYAGGAFYQQQPDGSFAVVAPPIGAIVPELPPGAVQVSLNGTIAYQFNGVYFEPVFVSGITQYEVVAP